jgi:hypothetical protein
MSESSYVLDGRDAALVVQTLYCVADMIEQPAGSRAHLSEDHLRVMTSPPSAVGFYSQRGRSANRLRRAARLIEQQLPDDAPSTEAAPYPYHAEHPPHVDWDDA